LQSDRKVYFILSKDSSIIANGVFEGGVCNKNIRVRGKCVLRVDVGR